MLLKNVVKNIYGLTLAIFSIKVPKLSPLLCHVSFASSFGGIMSHIFTEQSGRGSLMTHTDYIEGKRVKLRLQADHDKSKREVTITLLGNQYLPGHHGYNIFMYAGATILHTKAVKNPRVALCQSPQVCSFLNGLTETRQLEVSAFALTQSVLRYGPGLHHREVVRRFVEACAKALSIGDEYVIAVMTNCLEECCASAQ